MWKQTGTERTWRAFGWALVMGTGVLDEAWHLSRDFRHLSPLDLGHPLESE